jgi:hypothetical protein
MVKVFLDKRPKALGFKPFGQMGIQRGANPFVRLMSDGF